MINAKCREALNEILSDDEMMFQWFTVFHRT